MLTDSLIDLQEKIGYRFTNKGLLKNALTHSSYANEHHWTYNRNNERLEFLGDAVLELVSSEVIFKKHRDETEGVMTKLRASLVCEPSLADSARELELTQHLYLGKGEIRTGGGKRDSILSDAFEAIIGAIYLDGGFDPAKDFIIKYVLSDIEQKKLFYDSKTILQELVQSTSKKEIRYEIIKENGPDHDKEYTCACHIGELIWGQGIGKTKKSSEQKAAYEAILHLRQESK